MSRNNLSINILSCQQIAVSQPAAIFKRIRQLASLFLLSGLIVSCVKTALPLPSSEPIVRINSISIPSKTGGISSINAEDVTEGQGVASIQGRITYDPSLIQVDELSRVNGFVVMALDIDNDAGEVRFAIVRVVDEGVVNGPVANILVTATGSVGDETRLVWEEDSQTPIIVGGGNNQELTGINLKNGLIKIR